MKVTQREAKANEKCSEYCEDCFRCFEPGETYLAVAIPQGVGRPKSHRICDPCHDAFVVNYTAEAKTLDYQGLISF